VINHQPQKEKTVFVIIQRA